MKKLLWILPMLMSAFFVACKDDDSDNLFTYDANGNCVSVTGQQITEQEFQSMVVGYGWKCVAEYKIDSKGNLGTDLFTQERDGWSDISYFIGKDSLKRYIDSDALSVPCFTNDSYTYQPATAQIKTKHANLHFISVDKTSMTAVVNNSTYCRYTKMTDTEFSHYQKTYVTDYDNYIATLNKQK
jgi:hypothetical protein